MKIGRLMLITLALCTFTRGATASESRGPGGPASAPPALPAPSEAAKTFQQSYDAEATGKNDAALAALDALPQAQRDGYVAQLRRAWLLYRLGKYTESVAAYSKATAQNPSSVEAKVGQLAPLIALRRWIDAEAAAREVLRKDPANYTATLRLAFALFNQAKLAESEATYRSLVALYPSDVDARAGLGWAQLKQGRAHDAARTFGDILEIAPRNALAQDGLRAAMAKR